jgi:hypothetical protein
MQNKTARTALGPFAGNFGQDIRTELFFDIIVIRTYIPLKIPNQTIASLTHRPLLVEQVFSENPF